MHMNSKQRQFYERLPSDLWEIVAGLPLAMIDSFEAIGWSWVARIRCSGRLFELVRSERDLGYIDVGEIVGTARRRAYRKIMPPEDQRMQITPAQVCELLQRELAAPGAEADGGAQLASEISGLRAEPRATPGRGGK